MLKYRLIFGLLIIAALIGVLGLDSHTSRGWPIAAGSTTPGLFLALVSLIVIPFALVEMRGLLAKENVTISLRITIAAAALCMLWPWVEQVAQAIDQKHTALQSQLVLEDRSSGPAAVAVAQATHEDLDRVERSPWYITSRVFRSVKPEYLVPTILALTLVAAVVKHSRHRRVDGAMANAGGTLLAIVYLGVLPGFFLPICMTHSAWMVLAVVGMVKGADIGAYATGRLVGKHKLIPWLSPGKTVEGFFGGLVFSGLIGAGIAWYLQSTHGGVGGDPSRWIGISVAAAVLVGAGAGILLGAVGQLGDLLESLLKRDAGVKDSGACQDL